MNKRGKGNFKKIIKNNISMLEYISKYCPKFILVTVTIGLISSILRLTSTYYTKIVIDTMEIDGTIQKLILVIAVMMVINISLSSLANWLNLYVSNKYSFNLNYGMTLEIFEKLKTIDYENYHDTNFYNNVMKAIEQSDSRAKSVLDSINTLISSILNIGTFSIVISVFNPMLFILVAISVSASLFFSSTLSKIQHANYNANIKHGREKSYVQRLYFLENYAKEIRMNNGLNKMLDRKFKNATELLMDNTLKYSIKTLKINLFQLIVSIMVSSVITFYLGIKVIYESIKLSDYFFISSSVGQLVNLLTSLFNVIPKIYEDSLYIDDFLNFLNTEPKIKNVANAQNINKINTISFKNVSFNYPKTANRVLSSISFDITSGEKMLIIGRNGSGKSTLLKLLCRLYDTTEGELTINNTSIKNISVESVRSKIGIVFQDFEIYATSIIENILMRPIEDEVNDLAIAENALKATGLWDKVSRFDNGIYSTMTRELNDDGVLLSGGERQLLAISRMFAQDFDVVVFDEPFSALDPITEAELANKIIEIFHNKTVILVSHRLANVKNIGNIIYFENGMIEEMGTHEESYKINSKYKKLYDAQNGI